MRGLKSNSHLKSTSVLRIGNSNKMPQNKRKARGDPLFKKNKRV